MRVTDYSNFIRDANGIFGVNLGSSYSAEHESGTRPLLTDFGVKTETLGIDGRRITRVPTGLLYTTLPKSRGSLLVYESGLRKIPDYLTRKLTVKGGQSIVCAWDNDDFGVWVSKGYADGLRQIHDGFENLDIILSGASIFGGEPGFAIAISSRVPEWVRTKWYQEDSEKKQLRDAFQETGIESYLRQRGLTWFYLGPHYFEDSNLILWLNPLDQDKFEAGHYTLEELKLWAEGKGPVVRQKPR